MTSLVLIKNLDIEHLHTFRATGKVLLSSLKRLRKNEWEGRDELEGIKSIQYRFTQDKTYMPDPFKELLSPNIQITGAEYIHIGAGANVYIGTQLPDAYLFCTSIYRLENFGTASYKILDAKRFGNVLFESLTDRDPKVYLGVWGKVSYGGLKDPVSDLDYAFRMNYSGKDVYIDDYFWKPSSFSAEGEYRYVFFTLTHPIKDEKFIQAIELVKLCSF